VKKNSNGIILLQVEKVVAAIVITKSKNHMQTLPKNIIQYYLAY